MLKLILICFISILPMGSYAQPDIPPIAKNDAQNLLSAFMAYTDLRVRSVQQNLEILASTAEVKSGSWDEMKELLSTYQASDEGLIAWYAYPDGTYYTADKGLSSAKLNDRDYFPGLMKGKKVTGALVISKSTNRRSAVIAVPVKLNGQVVGALGVSVFLDYLANQVDAMFNFRTDASFFSLSQNGLTVLNKKTERHLLDPREQGSETLTKAINQILSGTSGEVNYEFDNMQKQAIYRTSPVTGWKFAITINNNLKE